MASQTSDPQPEGKESAETPPGGPQPPSSQPHEDAQTLQEPASEHIDRGPTTEDLDEDPAYNPQDEHLRGIKGG